MNKKNLANLLGIAVFGMTFVPSALHAQKLGKTKPTDNLETRVETLLKEMTLEEQIGQLNQQTYFELTPALIKAIGENDLTLLLTRMNPTSKGFPKPIEEMTYEEKGAVLLQMKPIIEENGLINPIKKGNIGSLLNTNNGARVNELQRYAIEETRLGIPMIIGRDVIHGFKTIFPIPLGQAASFNPNIVEEGARVAAVEASQAGINWTFAPMLDISRDPRWGRIAESLGEDPYLAGVLGAAMVKGFQGNDLSSSTSIASCVKHFVGYGAAEGGRDYNTTNIPPHLMHNVYLKPFEKAIQAGAQTLMTSFNENDGIPGTANKYLLRDYLRDYLKFDGFVVSDWNSTGELMSHGVAKDQKEVAELSIKSGVDMEMATGSFLKNLAELVKEKKVDPKLIEDAVRNILRVKFRLGLFENPYIDTEEASVFYAANHMQKAKDAAIESAILLKNEGILPLKKSQRIAIIGPLADAPHDQLGTWIFDGEKEHTVTPIGALKTSEFKDIKYVYEPALAYSRDKNTANFEKAKQAARQADVSVLFLGEESILSGEAHCLSNINLIGVQSELLKAVKSVGKPVVVVIMAGRPLTIERDLPYADAVLYNFHPGTMGGPAILDLLFGKANPSGKLPVTFLKEVGQVPMYYSHNETGRPALGTEIMLDDIPLGAGQTSLGNTSFYLDSGKDPLFPFGYGLSYSTFEISDLKLSSNELTDNGKIVASVSVKNTSKVKGSEVVQLYIRDLIGSITRPVKELKGFEKITLNPGESTTVKFEITTKDLEFYSTDNKIKAEPGDFKLWIGADSQSGLEGAFTLK